MKEGLSLRAHREKRAVGAMLGMRDIPSQNDAIDPVSFSGLLLAAETRHMGYLQGLGHTLLDHILYFPRKQRPSKMDGSDIQKVSSPKTPGGEGSQARPMQASSPAATGRAMGCVPQRVASASGRQQASLSYPKAQAFISELLLFAPQSLISLLPSSINRISFFLCHCA